MKIQDLLETMLQLKMTILNSVPTQVKTREVASPTVDPMLLVVNNRCQVAMVEMGILGTTLTDTIVDRGSGVNVLHEETWKKLGKPTLWPPTFNLLGANQHRIKPLGTPMG